MPNSPNRQIKNLTKVSLYTVYYIVFYQHNNIIGLCLPSRGCLPDRKVTLLVKRCAFRFLSTILELSSQLVSVILCCNLLYPSPRSTYQTCKSFDFLKTNVHLCTRPISGTSHLPPPPPHLGEMVELMMGDLMDFVLCPIYYGLGCNYRVL